MSSLLTCVETSVEAIVLWIAKRRTQFVFDKSVRFHVAAEGGCNGLHCKFFNGSSSLLLYRHQSHPTFLEFVKLIAECSSHLCDPSGFPLVASVHGSNTLAYESLENSPPFFLDRLFTIIQFGVHLCTILYWLHGIL